MSLKEDIININPLLVVEYKNYIDRFLSLDIFNRIKILVIFIFYAGLIFILFNSDLERKDKIAILFVLLFTIIFIKLFVLPKIKEINKYKVIFGKEQFMIFLAFKKRRGFNYIYFIHPYSSINSYTVKSKSILLQLNINVTKNIKYYHIGNLSSEEIISAKQILFKLKSNN